MAAGERQLSTEGARLGGRNQPPTRLSGQAVLPADDQGSERGDHPAPDVHVVADPPDFDVAALLAATTRASRAWYEVLRATIDVLVAAVGLLVCLPVLLGVAVAIFTESGRPVFYRQTRVGYLGRNFTLVKFRTMVQGAEAGGPRFTSENDPRVTRVGRVLRRTHLDEIPQLWNVLWRDMTLIGPRPERPRFARHYAATIPYWEIRHRVRPGITGWAQVTEGYTNDLEGTVRKLARDIYYLQNRGPFLDARVVVHTLRCMFTMAGR